MPLKCTSSAKGVVLAGGTGSRLSPVTELTCKQLLPVYDKPMIYYPVSTCLWAGLQEIMIISTPEALPKIADLLGDGSALGVRFCYQEQAEPRGIAEALILAEDFLDGANCVLALGDNIIHKHGIARFLSAALSENAGATVFGYPVSAPERFGVVELCQATGDVRSLEEKPANPRSNLALIGLYVYDATASERSKHLVPSLRGELEITDLNKLYFADQRLKCKLLGREDFWADAGTADALYGCAHYVRAQQHKHSRLIGSPEVAALEMGFVSRAQILEQCANLPQNTYATLLQKTALGHL